MQTFLKYSMLTFFCFSLFSCSTSSQIEQQPKVSSSNLYYDEYFTNYKFIPVESESDVFSIDEGMREMVRTKLLTVRNHSNRAKKLLKHIFNQEFVNLAYKSTATLTAKQAYYSQQANCLSLTIMSYVLAQEAGLNVEFQSVKIPEYWIRNGQYNQLTYHVNLLVSKPIDSTTLIWLKKGLQIDFDPNVLKKKFPTEKVNKTRILAMFYTNIGAQSIVDGDYTKAYAYLKQATLVSPNYASGWSNLAILYRLIDNFTLAERTYYYALTIEPDNYTVMDNLAILMRKQGLVDKAIEIEKKLHNKRINNPYYHALLGDEALYNGDAISAKLHYKRAIKLDNNIHEFYFGLAKVYYQLEEYSKAQNSLEKAVKLNKATSTNYQYTAKLNLLRSSVHNE